MISIRKTQSNLATKDKLFVCLWIVFLSINLSASAANGSAANSSFNYMGRLTQSNGAPLLGPVDLQINFYNTLTDGTPLGSSPYFFAAVTLDEGRFQIQIPLSGTDINAIFPDTNAETFIEVTNATDRKTYPRQRFSLVPYALKVPVDGKTLAFDSNGQLAVKDLAISKITDLADALAGKAAVNQPLVGDVSGTFGANTVAKLRGQDVSTTTPNSGEVLTFVDGKWTPKSLGAMAVGTVTSISAEAPLATTGPASSPKLILAQANGVASGYLASSDWLTFNNKQDHLGYTPLNQAGGTMSGTLNMGGKRLTNLPAPVAATDAVTKLYADATLLHRDGSVALSGPWAVGDDLTNVGNVNLSAQKTLGLGTYDADAEAILVASLKEDDQGKTWFSSSTSEIMYWDGHSVKPVGVARTGVMRMNGQGGNDQTLAKPGTTGTEPNWISDNNTHTLQIPLASVSGVTAGLISNDEYTIFQNKVNIAGDTMTGTLNLPANALIVGTNQLVLANNYVGIGTTQPESPLQIVGETTAAQLKVSAGAGATSGAKLTLDSRTQSGGIEWSLSSSAGNASEGVGKLLFINQSNGNAPVVFTSDGKVGIGSSAPAHAVDVVGTVRATSFIGTTDSNWNNQGLNNLLNLGIGTAAPGSDLSFGGGGARKIQVDANPSAAAGANLTLASGGAGVNASNANGGNLVLAAGNSTGTGTSSINFMTAPAGSSGSAASAATTKMTILGNGNVGIGVTEPSSILDVNGALTQRGMSAPTVSTAGQGVIYFDSGSGRFMASENTGAYSRILTTTSSVTNITATSPLVMTGTTVSLGTTPAANGGTGLITITTNGIPYGRGTSNVGVTAAGTQYQVLQAGSGGTPTFGAVNLGSNSAVNGTLLVTNGGTGATTFTSNGVMLGNGTNNLLSTGAGTAAQVLRIPTSGGTVPSFGPIDLTQTNSAVSGALPVANGGTGTTAAPSNGQLHIGNGTGFALTTMSQGTTAGVTINNGAGSITLDTAQDIRTSASPTFNTVNVTNLISPTVIAGSSEATATALGGTVRTANVTGTDKQGKDLTVTAGNGTGSGGSGNILFQTAPPAGAGATADTMATRMTITASGNVGIGTTSPSGFLDVNGGTAFNSVDGISLIFRAQNGGVWGSRATNGGAILLIPGAGGNGANTPGNVGIGTSAPAGFLDVEGGTAFDSTNGAPLIFRAQNGGSWGSRATIGGHILLLPGTGTWAAGNVGIGTTSPSAKLTVAGGQAVGAYYSTSSASIDWNNGNIQNTSVAAGTVSLASMIDGGVYTLVLSNSTGGNYTFTATGITFLCKPTCPVSVTAGTTTLVTILKAGPNAFVSWGGGYQ